jgi:hypothetical protein
MDNVYYMPRDDVETGRLSALQFVVRSVFEGRNILPPIPRTPSMIIDVGTGPGNSRRFGEC